jgi:hypothetical protein
LLYSASVSTLYMCWNTGVFSSFQVARVPVPKLINWNDSRIPMGRAMYPAMYQFDHWRQSSARVALLVERRGAPRFASGVWLDMLVCQHIHGLLLLIWRRYPMAVVQIHELPGMTREQYESDVRTLNLSGPPPGSHLHAAGPMEGGWRIVEVWDSEEAAATYYGSEQFQEMMRSSGTPQPNITSYSVETILK